MRMDNQKFANHIACAVLLAAALFWRRHPRRCAGAIAAALTVLFVAGSPPLSNLLMRWTESGGP